MPPKPIIHPDEQVILRVLQKNKGTITEIILRLAWNAGLTRDEINQLKWIDISFADKEINLLDRTIPLDDTLNDCLQKRYHQEQYRKQTIGRIVSPFVVTSDRNHTQLEPQTISRMARVALNEEGLTDISLKDLQQDYIVRQLESHDWPYVARISGMAVSTLHAKYSTYLKNSSRDEKANHTSAAQEVDEYKMWKVLQEEGNSPVSLALWMAWKLGMQAKDIISLTWDQVDLSMGIIHLPMREVTIGVTLGRKLTQIQALRKLDEDPHVLLTPNSRQPYDQPRLSKLVRTALIRGGMENLTLRDLTLAGMREAKDTMVLDYAKNHGNITKSQTMNLTQESKVQVYSRLSRLTEQGKLVRIGMKYYPEGTVVAPEKHYEVIKSYLEKEGSATRQGFRDVLHIKDTQCTTILKHLVQEGKLIKTGQRYSLPSEETKKNT